MKKFYQIAPVNAGTVPSFAAGTYFAGSVEDAARKVSKFMEANKRNGYQYDYYILEAVKAAKVPEPQPVELVDLE